MKNLPSEKQAIDKTKVIEKLHTLGQQHLLEHLSSLDSQQSAIFFNQVASLDPSVFLQCQKSILAPPNALSPHAPYRNFQEGGSLTLQAIGKQQIKEGKVALVVLAGGQGSRLRFDGPKGCVPVTRSRKKTLFQLLAEKVKAAGVQVKKDLELAIMTSPLNHQATEKFFKEHGYFGLAPHTVTFFTQEMWPLLNFNGDLFFEGPGRLAFGPNGNGGVFRSLIQCGLWKKWGEQGVESVCILPVDNPLAPPFDAELVGLHAHNGNEITMRSTFRRDAKENVGVLTLIDGKPTIIEYTDLTPPEKEAKDNEGNLIYGVANLGIFCFSMAFIERVSQYKLPVHAAKKAVLMLFANDKALIPSAPNAWKCEEYIFDYLPLSHHFQAALFPRASCFAPLKNLHGEDSIDTVQAALLASDRQVFAQITGHKPPKNAVFELAPQFYYPTQELIEKWRDQPLPNGEYIDA